MSKPSKAAMRVAAELHDGECFEEMAAIIDQAFAPLVEAAKEAEKVLRLTPAPTFGAMQHTRAMIHLQEALRTIEGEDKEA